MCLSCLSCMIFGIGFPGVTCPPRDPKFECLNSSEVVGFSGNKCPLGEL